MHIWLSTANKSSSHLLGYSVGNPKAAAHVAVRPSVLVTVKLQLIIAIYAVDESKFVTSSATSAYILYLPLVYASND